MEQKGKESVMVSYPAIVITTSILFGIAHRNLTMLAKALLLKHVIFDAAAAV